MTNYPLSEQQGISYIDLGNKDEVPLVLLHGLFGTASNFDHLIAEFSKERRILMPILPIFEMSLRKLSLGGLLEYFEEFLTVVNVARMHLLGNSLGGHIALLYALKHQDTLLSLTLTGSSGLYESSFGTSFPKREDYEYIKKKVTLTFYEPNVATKDMVDEVFEVVNNRSKAIRIVKTAKSAIRNNIEKNLIEIKVPTLLVWGEQDTITPKFVGEKFHELITSSQLVMIDKCGHAPMLERPNKFNEALHSFLKKVEAGESV